MPEGSLEGFPWLVIPTCPLPLVGDLYPKTPTHIILLEFLPDMECPGAFGFPFFDFPVLFCSKLESVEPLFLELVIKNQLTFGFAANGDMIEGNFLSG